MPHDRKIVNAKVSLYDPADKIFSKQYAFYAHIYGKVLFNHLPA